MPDLQPIPINSVEEDWSAAKPGLMRAMNYVIKDIYEWIGSLQGFGTYQVSFTEHSHTSAAQGGDYAWADFVAADVTWTQAGRLASSWTGGDLFITAGTISCSDLTDGYIPYHVSDAAGLANSALYLDTTNKVLTIGVGNAYPQYIHYDGWAGLEVDSATPTLVVNAYYSDGWKYRKTGFATKLVAFPGVFKFQTAPSGTAGDPVTFTERMRLDTTGLGIATDSPVCRLEVEDGITTASMLVKITQDDQTVYGLVIGNDTYSTTDTNGLRLSVTNAGVAIIDWTGASLTLGSGAAGIDYTLTFNGENNDGVVTWMEDEDYFKFSDNVLLDTGSLYLTEIAAAQADIAAKGQIWVKNDTPNTLWFTDDAGTDFQLGSGVAANPFEVGTADDVPGVLDILSGGNTEAGGTLKVELPPDQDGTIANFQFGVAANTDDLIIGPNTDLDALKLDNDKDFHITAGDLVTVAGQTITQNGSHDKQSWQRGIFTYNGGATAYTVKVTSAAYWVKDKFCWWDAELTTGAIGGPAGSTWYYLYIDYSAVTMGTEITATELIWSSTAPAWSTTYACWMNGDDRCIFAALTNATPTNISGFFHDGGDLVIWPNYVVEYASGYPSTTWTDVDLKSSVPAFSTKVLVLGFGIYGAGPGSAYCRTNGEAGATFPASASGHMLAYAISTVDQYVSGTAIVATDSAQVVEVVWDTASGNPLYLSVDAWYFPAGM